jgi:hypothetical protein
VARHQDHNSSTLNSSCLSVYYVNMLFVYRKCVSENFIYILFIGNSLYFTEVCLKEEAIEQWENVQNNCK